MKKYFRSWKARIFFILFVFFAVLCLLRFQLFPNDYSTVVFTEKGELVGARLANDGQWRFPPMDTVPYKLKKTTLCFEDRHFYHHPGVNPVSIFRALRLNLSAGRVVSGGSTISMQVIRMSRNHRKRVFTEKIIEAFGALWLELHYSKEEILSMYVSNAPYGGNTVGVQTASWRYYQRAGKDLSWAEAALLAVLPNAPSMIHVERNRESLKRKRDALLRTMCEQGEFNEETLHLSMDESLPEQVFSLQVMAPHLVDRMNKERHGQVVHVTLNASLQKNVEELASRYKHIYSQNGVQNLSVLVQEVSTGNVLCYCGNAAYDHKDDNQVDVIRAPRSTGSILKPFLYCAMIEDGQVTPRMLVPDVPIQIAGYKPQNFNRTFDGAVPAHEALTRSLNIPAVLMLRKYGIPLFQDYLRRAGITTLSFSPDHYGLTLILGGAEATLWDVSGVYASMARVLNRYNRDFLYDEGDIHAPRLCRQEEKHKVVDRPVLFHAGSVWHTMDAIKELNRPDVTDWRVFSSSRKIGWKTGTSFGNRDAWAVGATPEYVVGVWVGNADGEGRPDMTGVGYAAPVMFAVYNILPNTSWFACPQKDFVPVELCHQSGFLRGKDCPPGDSVMLYAPCANSEPCPYHQIVHLSKDEKYRVSAKCMSPLDMVHKSWFILPPAIESFYCLRNTSYMPLPPYMPGCEDESASVMEFIYPKDSRVVYIPKEMDGKRGEVIFEVAHRQADVTLYWHLDDTYLGETKRFHQKGVSASEGEHTITVVDEAGNRMQKKFKAIVTD